MVARPAVSSCRSPTRTRLAINGFLATTVDQRSDDGRGTNPDGTIRYLCDSGDPETSTGKSLSALVGEPSLQDALRTNIVILLTDGAESGECTGGCDAACAAQNLLMQPQPVKTYVIGLGLNQGVLDQVAAAGGTSRMVPANNLAELNQAFDQIAKVVASCEYVLDQAPPGLDLTSTSMTNQPESRRTDEWLELRPGHEKAHIPRRGVRPDQERSSDRHRHRLRLPRTGPDLETTATLNDERASRRARAELGYVAAEAMPSESSALPAVRV